MKDIVERIGEGESDPENSAKRRRRPRRDGKSVSKVNGSRVGRNSELNSLKHLQQGLDAAEERLAKYGNYFSEGTKEELYFRTTRDIVLAARCWRRVANNRVAAARQTMARWETLCLVAYSSEHFKQGELAQLIGVQGPTMVRMLDTLARDGLIERYQDESDRRVTNNRVTRKGMHVIGKIMKVTTALRAELLRDIDPRHLVICVDVLSRILRRLDEFG